MALKDWKKIEEGKITTWTKGDIDVVVSNMVGRPVEDEKKPYGVLIAKVKGNHYDEQLISKWFETKSQALSFTKQYMRKH